MNDQPQAQIALGEALGSPEHRGTDDVELDDRGNDPVNRAARELVGALIDSRWSLEAAAVVVALRHLCETVEGVEVDTMLASWRLRGRVATGGQCAA